METVKTNFPILILILEEYSMQEKMIEHDKNFMMKILKYFFKNYFGDDDSDEFD